MIMFLFWCTLVPSSSGFPDAKLEVKSGSLGADL